MCSMDKLKMKGEKNWQNLHKTHINRFLHKINKIETKLDEHSRSPPRRFNTEAFNRYLVWFRSSARTQLKAPAFDSEDIFLEPSPAFNETSRLEYNKLVRDGTRMELAPIVRFTVSFALF